MHLRQRTLLGVLALLLVLCGPARPAARAQESPPAGPATLLRDINPSTGDTQLHGSMLGEQFIFWRGLTELWISDGSAGGARLLATFLAGGERLSLPIVFNGQAYFYADDGVHGYELWRSDGTPQGTRLVADINPGPGDGVLANPGFVVHRGLLYLTASDGVHGYELWRSDGTPQGTRLAADVVPGAQGIAPFFLVSNGRLLFFTLERLSGVFVSDGTAGGTRRLANPQMPPHSAPYLVVAAGNIVYFNTYEDGRGCELWRSDGTPAGTGPLVEARPGERPLCLREHAVSDGRLFFQGDGPQLFVSDGTAQGTRTLLDLSEGDRSTLPWRLGVTESWVAAFTITTGPGETRSFTLWAIDRAGMARKAFTSPEEGSVSDVLPMASLGGLLYFTVEERATGGSIRTLWQSDGTPGGTRPLDLSQSGRPTPLDPSLLAVGVERVFFSAVDGLHGRELWAKDRAGARLVADLNNAPAGSSPGPLRLVGSRLLSFHSGSARESQGELWASDGTPAGTRLVRQLPFKLDSPSEETWVIGERLIFRALLDTGQLWVSDGTPAGTLPIYLPADPMRDPFLQGVLARGRLYFTTGPRGLEEPPALWASDGTAAGTRPVANPWPAHVMVGAGERLFGFEQQAETCRLWVGDGTAAGSAVIKQFARVGGICADGAVAAGPRLFIPIPSAAGADLWVSDGTPAGTALVAANVLGRTFPGSGRSYFVRFEAQDQHFAVWESDGAPAGTRRIMPLPGYEVQAITPVGELVFVLGRFHDSTGARAELRVSDRGGRDARVLYSITPGEDWTISDLTAMGNTLLFTVDTPDAGKELWRSNGTPAGTYRVQDLWPGPAGSFPSHFVRLGERIIFAADDEVSGRELRVIGPGSYLSAPARAFVEPGGRVTIPVLVSHSGLGDPFAGELRMSVAGLRFVESDGPQPIVSGDALSFALPAPAGLLSQQTLLVTLAPPAGARPGDRFSVGVSLPVGEGSGAARTLAIEVVVGPKLYLPAILR